MTDDQDVTAGRWATGVRPDRAHSEAVRDAVLRGRLFFTRIEGLPGDKWGQSLLKSPYAVVFWGMKK